MLEAGIAANCGLLAAAAAPTTTALPPLVFL